MSSPRTSGVHFSFEAFDPCSEAFNNVADMSDFIEFSLELIDLSDDVSEASDLGVGSSHRSASARGLIDGRYLGLSRKLHTSED